MDRMDLNCYNSRLEINLSRIGRNIDKIRAYTGGLGLIPVVKSNAYGYGTAAVANFLVRRCGIRFLAVARLFEARPRRRRKTPQRRGKKAGTGFRESPH